MVSRVKRLQLWFWLRSCLQFWGICMFFPFLLHILFLSSFFVFFFLLVESCSGHTIVGYHAGFFMTDKKGNSIWSNEKLGIVSRNSWEAERLGQGEESASLYFRPALLLTHHCQYCDLWLASPTPVVLCLGLLSTGSGLESSTRKTHLISVYRHVFLFFLYVK